MKKTIAAILVICVVLSLAGCRGGDPVKTENNENNDTHIRSEDVDSGDNENADITSGSITLYSYYWWHGDFEADSYVFHSGNTFVYYDLDEEVWRGTYVIEGNELTITWEDSLEEALTIEDGGSALVDEDGNRYYLMD